MLKNGLQLDQLLFSNDFNKCTSFWRLFSLYLRKLSSQQSLINPTSYERQLAIIPAGALHGDILWTGLQTIWRFLYFKGRFKTPYIQVFKQNIQIMFLRLVLGIHNLATATLIELATSSQQTLGTWQLNPSIDAKKEPLNWFYFRAG